MTKFTKEMLKVAAGCVVIVAIWLTGFYVFVEHSLPAMGFK